VAMPKYPNREASSSRLADGARISSTTYTTMFGAAGFIAIAHEVEGGIVGDPIDTAGAMLESFLDDAEGYEIVGADATVRDGHPGTLVALRLERDERQAQKMIVHTYAGRSRVYLFASMNQALEDATIVRAEAQFFGSIRLDTSDAPSPTGDGHLDFAAFATIHPPEAGIAVDLPGPANRATRDAQIAGVSARLHEYTTATPDHTTEMIARVFTYDERPDEVLASLREIARNGEGEIGTVRPAQRQGYGGQAYMIESATRTRYVVDLLVPGGAVQLVHSMPRGHEAEQADHRRRFLNSLRVF